ncbi:hypothetical protein C8F01DRAFT_1149278 [Mycena amicta]|nr:hypothetical protein C8F01DRAFT_1149278 [Mycena amicta]
MSDQENISDSEHSSESEVTEVEPKMPARLPTPFEYYCVPPLTLSELMMYQLSWSLRRTPDWQNQVADPETRAKWREEAVATAQEKIFDVDMIDYVLAELDGYARIADNETGIERACFDGIWYSDRIMSPELVQRLENEVRVLEDIPEAKKDWLPGSAERQVLALVDHSLYCVVYGRTHAYLPNEPRISDNFLPALPPWIDTIENSWVSQQFCWLPSDLLVDDSGSVKLLSPYINNLHPERHQSLYRVIEEVIAGLVPLWEHVLGDVNCEGKTFPWDKSGRLQPVSCIWGPDGEPYPDEFPPDEDEDEFLEKFLDAVPKHLPRANEYTGQLEKRFKSVPLRGRTIQCIVHLTNIQLTPESPIIGNGDWEIAGMANERIIACATYCYAQENIASSSIDFRVATDEPDAHNEWDSDCMQTLYGIDADDPCVQKIGFVSSNAGRALAWPNIFQHRVSRCKLADPSKPGHRKLLNIFLVDPTAERVVSATDVPPQQADWAAEALAETFDSAPFCNSSDPDEDNAQTHKLPFIPQELRDLVKECVDSTESMMTVEDAKEQRLKLMEERRAFGASHTERIFAVPFNISEH